jgi:DNA-binding MarR family transcriptional regulator
VTDDSISEEVRKAVVLLVDSLDQLEVLLMLYREPERAWSADEAAATLGVAPGSAARLLAKMEARGVAASAASSETRWRYRPAGESQAAAAALIAQAHGTRRIALINHVATLALERVRELAEAFRVGAGKERKKDG